MKLSIMQFFPRSCHSVTLSLHVLAVTSTSPSQAVSVRGPVPQPASQEAVLFVADCKEESLNQIQQYGIGVECKVFF